MPKNKSALIITPDGVETAIVPANGTDFSLAECQKVVGGYIETVPAHDGRMIILNEEGKLNGLPYNEKASKLYRYFRDGDPIVGTVLVCDDDMLK